MTSQKSDSIKTRIKRLYAAKNNVLFVGSGKISPEPFVYAECEKSLGKNFKQHCDYHELVSDKGMIGIGAVRELLSSIKRYPSFSDEHIMAIPEIDFLTVEAQNALLKVVEEGQDNVVFFCGCRRRSRGSAKLYPR